jgi:hypothetical protein
MTIAQGINKKNIYKKQSALGSPATGSGGQDLRRINAPFNLAKETYQSNEIRPDQQVADMRHGTKQINGTLSGELSAKTYSDFFATVLRKAWASAFTDITGLSLTIAASGSNFTITRGTGDFIAGGVRVGHVVKISAGSVNAANLTNHVVVLSLTATVLTVKPLGTTAMVAEGPIASCTLASAGKTTYVPASGHTNDYYSIESWYSDIAQSELYTDVKPSNAQVKIPSNGMATVDFPMIGLNVTTNTTQQITSTNATTTTGIDSGANGVLAVGGTTYATITSIEFDVNGNVAAADGVVGSTLRPDVFSGTVAATGTITAHFDSVTLRDAFFNESEATVCVALAATTAKNTDFIAFTFPRIKFSGADRDDVQTGLKITLPFTALKNEVTGTGLEVTTIMIQDSQAA